MFKIKILRQLIIIFLIIFLCGCRQDPVIEPIILNIPVNLIIENEILTWDEVPNAGSYCVNVDGDEYSVVTNSFSLDFLIHPKTYIVKVKSIGNQTEYLDSAWSQEEKYIIADEIIKTYTIYFNKQGGSEGTDSVTVKNGDPLPSALQPQREGYLFLGYYNAAIGGIKYYDDNMAGLVNFTETKDITLFAKWQELTYLITLDKQGGSGGTNSVIVGTGNPLPVALAPSREGYLFLGYYDALTDGVKYYDENMIGLINFNKTEDMILYARWQELDHTIYFDKQGGSGGTNNVTLKKNDPLPAALAPSREGYLFLGYYDALTDGVKYYDENMVGLINFLETKDIVLYARWQLCSFTYQKKDSDIIITGYVGNPMAIIIPNSINGLLVTEIASNAFNNCTSLVKIILPDSLVTIKANAFLNCYSLELIEFKENLINIENNAFQNCSSLVSLTLPESLQIIADNAFRNCTKLQEIIIPDNVINVGEYAFSFCVSLQDITIKSDLEIISNSAFYECHFLRNVRLGNNIKIIEANAFYNCFSLEEIIISSDIINVGEYAFAYCRNLEVINLDSLENLGMGAFLECNNLRNVTLADSLTIINKSTFENCFKLTNIILPQLLENIDSYAFFGSALEEIIIPDSVSEIGSSAFANCQSLQVVSLSVNVIKISPALFADCISLNSINLDSIQTIEESGFANCLSLSDIVLSDNVVQIGFGAFFGCLAVMSATLPFIGESLDNPLEKHFGYIFGASSALEQNDYLPPGLSSVIVLQGNDIGSYAFYDCHNINNISFPDYITSIGEYAFAGCHNLNEIYLAESVSYIGEYAFYDCYNLIISAHFPSKPDSWEENWNPSAVTVIWLEDEGK